MIVKRTARANTAAAWISDPWSGHTVPMADVVYGSDCYEYSTVLGPDGKPLQYEPRPAIGFDLRGRK